ncbi:MAG TPA: hypothetical protein VFC17_02655, partial [Candidatus Limnocylindrales bacterium]|nr:hypothetical protein [Candidatus Limnocylindrales bacterium]
NITNAQPADAVGYFVKVSNPYGFVNSSPATLRVGGDPAKASGTLPVQISVSGIVVKQPGKNNLVIVTHGWVRKWDNLFFQPPPVLQPWVTDMANAIQSRVASDWQVVAVDWSMEAWTFLPDSAFDIGKNKGFLLGKALAAQGWQKIHFIGHSAGSALIQAAADAVRAGSPPATMIHTTFLDPYLRTDFQGRNWYGKNADWSDCYYAYDVSDKLPLYPPNVTSGPLDNTFNVDVSWIDLQKKLVPRTCPASFAYGSTTLFCTTNASSSHEYPHDFYTQTILGTETNCPVGYGFPVSMEGGSWANQVNYKQGFDSLVPCGIPSPAQDSFPVSYVVQRPISQLPSLASDSGVSINGGGASLSSVSTTTFTPFNSQNGIQPKGGSSTTTNIPAWLMLGLTITNSVNFVQFDSAFIDTNAAEGLLTVYWNTNQIGMVDERVASTNWQTYRFALRTTVTNDLHTLAFRLDSFNGTSSSVIITNVATGFMGVEQPITLTVASFTNSTPILQLTAAPNYNYLVESSSNLVDWAPFVLVGSTNGSVLFSDMTATNSPARFYRAVMP